MKKDIIIEIAFVIIRQEPPVTDWWHERIKKTHLTFSVSQNNISVF